MTEPTLPRYPVFVPTKGRAHNPLTIRFLQEDEVPFRIVVVPEEVEQYRALVDDSQILVLPRSDLKLVGTRNWIRDVAEQEGWARHWQLDDNIRRVNRLFMGERYNCDSGPALRAIEDFSDRYSNIGISGFNYRFFATPNLEAYSVNTHVYSATLVNHKMPCRWRLIYNDDTDLCLQALSEGWCTVLVNAFLVDKMKTMVVKGGNTDDLYQGDGRLVMARALERMWPHHVRVERRFQRPQHVIDWRQFKQRLQPLDDGSATYTHDDAEYGLRMIALRDVKSPHVRRHLEAANPGS